jgi:hypothetical protein
VSGGFLVVGVSEGRLMRARAVHERRGVRWNPELFARVAIPHRLRVEPFADYGEAEAFAEVARAAGALAVEVRQVEASP